MKPIAITTVIFSVLLTGLVVLPLCETADSGTIFRGANIQTTDGCCQGKRGNVDGTGIVDLVDLSTLVNYLTVGSYIPPCMDEANINGVGIVDLVDLSSLVNYLTTGVYVLPDCPASTVTDIDGNEYKTVKIGTQVWMAENLRVIHYRNGDSIPNVADRVDWSALTTGAYCEYNNNMSNVATYGRLYNWYAVSDGRNIAPAGWHVPTDAEWWTLLDSLGGDVAAGGKMKEADTTHWLAPNTGATNESGFSALPGGYRDFLSGYCYSMGTYAYFWSSTEDGSYSAWYRALSFNYSDLFGSSYYRGNGFSVRCVRDN